MVADRNGELGGEREEVKKSGREKITDLSWLFSQPPPLYSNAFRRRSIAREIAREMRGGFSMYWLFTNFSVRVIFKTLTEKLFHSDQYCKGFVFSKRGIKFNNKVTILKRAHSLACLKISQLRRHGKKRVHTTESGERRVSSAWT